MASFNEDEFEAKMLDLLEEVSDDEEVREHLDEDLFELGFLDSMAAVELLVDIEDEFGVRIEPTEFPREQMNTVHKIMDRVRERLQ